MSCSKQVPAVPPAAPAVPGPNDARIVHILAVINEIIETTGPSFLTDHPRFLADADQAAYDMPPFTQRQYDTLISFVRSREERPQVLNFIYERMPDDIRDLIYDIYLQTAVLVPRDRSLLAVIIMVGYLAYYHRATFRFRFRLVTCIQNVLYANTVATSSADTRPLHPRFASLATQSGRVHDFHRLRAFDYLARYDNLRRD